MIIRLHFAIGVRKNSFMRQGSLFSRAHIAEMRDPAKARNHSPEREEFRRAQQRRRVFGLERRHAEKLRRLRRDGATAPAPTGPGCPATPVASPVAPVAPLVAPVAPLVAPTTPPVAPTASPVAPVAPLVAPVASPVAPTTPPVGPAAPLVVAAPRTRPATRCVPDNRRPPTATESIRATATASPAPRTAEAPNTPYPANPSERPTVDPSAQVRQPRLVSPPRRACRPPASVPQASPARPHRGGHRNPRHLARSPQPAARSPQPAARSPQRRCCSPFRDPPPWLAGRRHFQPQTGNPIPGTAIEVVPATHCSRWHRHEMSPVSTDHGPSGAPRSAVVAFTSARHTKTNGRTTEYNRSPINS
ncbi:hypothetical protein BJ964_004248 [Actinoplanes lobatus]|uniref:Uncharacterized protein n=1 Tax=Actinoplanes lobatus TaxID=113568 RepID=A0A7W7HGG4_9ACTN|nr:hypothetical protein [Actinoplanes lobatus]